MNKVYLLLVDFHEALTMLALFPPFKNIHRKFSESLWHLTDVLSTSTMLLYKFGIFGMSKMSFKSFFK